MKGILASILGLSACNTTAEQQEGLHTGDLIFVGIPSNSGDGDAMGGAIAAATGEGEMNYIHVAIAEVAKDGVWIIDATSNRGVDRHPLDTFIMDFKLPDGSLPRFDVKRLQDTSNVAAFVENAKKHIGRPYDFWFLPDNGAYYCSELVRDSYSKDGEPIFNDLPMNFLGPDGELPEYWSKLFAKLGIAVPQGVSGTNPEAMSSEKCLKTVDIDITKEI